MMHVKSESDVTSLAPSSPPRSPKRAAYYVQSPSRDSHDDGDNKSSSSMQPTPVFNSPMESPSHPSTFDAGRHSRASSASRFSGAFGRSSAKSKHRRSAVKGANDKGWPECGVIMEEGSYGDLDGSDGGLSRRCQVVLAFVSFVLLFATFCLIIWGASRPYKPGVIVKSLSVSNFYFGEGSDSTGVPTKMITLNCSVKLSIYNPASTFGIHVSSGPVDLMYSRITIATGQLPRHYQPKKSHRIVSMAVLGEKVPLYGAGAGLPLSSTGGAVPLTLDFEIYSRAYVVGKLVRVKHRKHVSCLLAIDSSNTKPITFSQKSCNYD